MTVQTYLLDKTGDEIREMARDCYRRREESWERSDSDGFLSQWAMQEMASRYQAWANLADRGWVAESAALFDAATGELLDSRMVDSQYGSRWMVTRGSDRQFLSYSLAKKADRRRAYYAKHGVTLGRVARRVVPLSDGHTMPDRDYPDVTVISTDDVGEDWV